MSSPTAPTPGPTTDPVPPRALPRRRVLAGGGALVTAATLAACDRSGPPGVQTPTTDAAGGRLEVTSRAAATQDFTATIANHADTGFGGLAVAMMPGAINELTLRWRPEGADAITSSLRIKAPETASGSGTALSARIARTRTR